MLEKLFRVSYNQYSTDSINNMRNYILKSMAACCCLDVFLWLAGISNAVTGTRSVTFGRSTVAYPELKRGQCRVGIASFRFGPVRIAGAIGIGRHRTYQEWSFKHVTFFS